VSSGRPHTRAQIAQKLQRASGRLSTAATTQMEQDLPWVVELPAEDRSFIGLIVQAGIKSFIDWFRRHGTEATLRTDVFGVAPTALAAEISLQQTVSLVRLSIEVVEAHVVEVVGEDDAEEVHEALNRYAREIAFATAEVYARAAEQRGAWDARLEALVVDSVLRAEADETVRSRASALGWESKGNVVVVLGRMAETGGESSSAAPDTRDSVVDEVRRSARHMRLDALCAVQGDRLVVVLGGVDDPDKAGAAVAGHFGEGPVVVGPVVVALPAAGAAAAAALAALRVADGWAGGARPLRAEDLLVERALLGDAAARAELVAEAWQPLAEAGGSVLETLEAYFLSGGSLEATGRALFVHPNTVRYRLKRVSELTGRNPAEARDGYTLRVALSLGRLSGTP
jgi:DNA-binding PucR family transcriptional regulator